MPNCDCTYKEDGYPCQANVVEGDSSLEGVVGRRLALGVILVPVDTGLLCRRVSRARDGTIVANHVSDLVVRQVGTLVHAVVLRLRADVIPVLLHVSVIGRQRSANTSHS